MEIEPGQPQPTDRQRFQRVPDLEDPQYPAGQFASRIDRGLGVLLLQRALACDAEA